MRKAFEGVSSRPRAWLKFRQGPARRVLQCARNMPEEQPRGNRMTRSLEMSVARMVVRDGLPLGIDEPHSFSRFDPTNPRDRQTKDRGQTVNRLCQTRWCSKQQLVIVASGGQVDPNARFSVSNESRRGR